jgi:hypothetical protein
MPLCHVHPEPITLHPVELAYPAVSLAHQGHTVLPPNHLSQDFALLVTFVLQGRKQLTNTLALKVHSTHSQPSHPLKAVLHALLAHIVLEPLQVLFLALSVHTALLPLVLGPFAHWARIPIYLVCVLSRTVQLAQADSIATI